MLPDKVSVPEVRISAPPVPEIVPLNVPLALLRLRVFEPSVTDPAPLNVTIVAPLVVLLISKVPAAETPLLEAIEPEPDRLSVPAVMVVAPV